ncbi:MAG: formyltetrahydrofolate deformylase [Steroidobacteraceae bacterium]|nr:formyltetrahydrofolate deformylase [Nevskiaceae bacterium]MCP5359526.1 formyltetrahydrofolate deformylase [Nevskiaceae bacterium]MCP5467474.1 formyltetrahydrofolate deformylase [Nevskiaceae bacterium]
MQHPPRTESPKLDLPPRFVLTTQCPDTTGIVAAVAGFLAAHNCLITEAQHFDDPVANVSFMRTVFHDNGHGIPSLEELDRAFAGQPGARFGMSWKFHETRRHCRTVLAVSKQGHCLNSILHRWSTGTLPIEVVAVVSNHQDLRSLAEWHGVPFHYFPISDGRKIEQEHRILELLERIDAELLVLARYMQVLTPEACARLVGRAINIHHSFLPGFKGARAYHQAYARGVKLIGATAHYVTTDLDEGPIIEQEVERVDHTLSPEELTVVGSELESLVLNRAIKWHAERRVFRNGAKTVVLR